MDSLSREGDLPAPSGATARLFVGRERELSALTAGLEEAVLRRGNLFLLSGEPGIGKTRLANEVANLAACREARVLWGHAWEGGGQPAYWPWVQVLRSYVRSEDLALLAAELGGGAVYVSQLVPELASCVPASPDALAAARLDSDNARFYLFDSVTEFLRAGAARHPLVIVLDDVHAADLPSLLLLQFLAAELREMRVLVIGTYRGVEARRAPEVGSLLAQLGRAGRHISLGGLAERDIALLIEGSTGIAPSAELVSAVHRVTEGNPFFADEIIRLLASEGRLQLQRFGTRLGLPDGVREAIRRRLAPLSNKCQEILSVAAVAGREFDAGLLQAVSDRPIEQVTEVLDDAVAAEIVEPLSAPFGRFRFFHPLIRDTLYEDLSSVRRQQLHRNIGEILERLCAGNLERDVSELAYHFCQAAPTGVAELAVEYAVRAAQRAMRLLAYEEAVGHFELALHTLDLVSEPREDLRCELLLGLGTAQGAAGDHSKSRETFVRAADAARIAGDAEKLADAALGLGQQSAFVESFEGGRNIHGPLVQLLEEAIAALPAHDSPLRARLLSRLAAAIFWKPASDERKRSLVREAVEMAERLGNSGALTAALINKRIALMGPDDAEERLADATRVLHLVAETGDQEREFHAREACLYDLLELGDVAAADIEIERIQELARALRQPRYLADAEMIKAMRTLMDGRLDQGREVAQRALVLNQRVRPEIAETLYGSQMFRTVWREKGQLAELDTGMKALLDQEAPILAANCALAFVHTEQGKEEQARVEFERIAADDFSSIPREVSWTCVMANLTEICCFLGDLPRAQMLYEQLLPFAAMNVVIGPVPHTCWGPIAHYLGMLASTLGEQEKASQHFEFALQMETKMRMPAMRARTLCEYGRMLIRIDRPDDANRGANLLVAALEIARPLGMTVLEKKLSTLLAESSDQTAGRTVDSETETVLESAHNVFRREGEYWTIAFETQAFRLRDTKGLAYLAELLRNPGRQFFAPDLAGFGNEPVGHESRRLETAAVSGEPGEDAASVVERARQSVTIAIRTALKRISENSPALGRHLASTVKTGKFCAYVPDPGSAPSWRV